MNYTGNNLVRVIKKGEITFNFVLHKRSPFKKK